jgi:hypothetical protein
MIRTKPNPANPILVAPCGINCRLCMAYGRDKNPCPGCRIDDPDKHPTCVNCKIKNCAKLVAGGFQYCFECDDFPCERITHLDNRYRTKYATSPIDNLLTIQRIGVRKFTQFDIQRWTCPKCGAVISMHRPNCLSCGYLWHK